VQGLGFRAESSADFALFHSSGTDNNTPTQNRRVMSRSSGFSPSVPVGVMGSSAMPQIGQEPGSDRTICGCIGQVHKFCPTAAARQHFDPRCRPVPRMQAVLTRAGDVLIAVALIVLTLPLIGLLCLAIKLDSRGPVFAWQPRL
jgi:hypothetical protein